MILFTTTRRGKIVLLMLVLSATAILTKLAGVNEASWRPILGCSATVVVSGLILLKKDIKYMLTPKETLWARWESLNTNNDQRIKMGDGIQNQAYWELKTSEVGKCAKYVVGLKEFIRTTLKSCTCDDFKKEKVPCKHMYRLAKDLGIKNLPKPLFVERSIDDDPYAPILREKARMMNKLDDKEILERRRAKKELREKELREKELKEKELKEKELLKKEETTVQEKPAEEKTKQE